MCGCEFACGHEHGGVCLGVLVWVFCNAGLLACSQSIILWGFLCFFLSHSIFGKLSLLCLAFYYYVSILLVSCYLFYPLWVTGDSDILGVSLSLI